MAAMKVKFDPTRMGAIKSALAIECSKFLGADLDKATAKEAASAADAEGKSIREIVMSEIAKLSRDNQWREVDVKEACKMLKKEDNSGTVTTFMSEIMNCASPQVRDVFTDLVSMRDALWPADADPELNPVNPDVLKCWNRRYHMLTQMTRCVRKGEAMFNGVDDVIEYAKNNNPDENPDKVQSRLEKIAEQLGDMWEIFPDDDLKLAREYIEAIDAKKLIEARASVISPAAPKAPAVVRALKPVPSVKQPTTVVENNDTMAPGAVDIEDLLGDKPAHLIGAAA